MVSNPAARGHIRRSDVVALVSQGPPAFLQKIDVAPQQDSGGKFVGWRIVSFADSQWQQGPLLPGDVVARVNGKSIERPFDFFDVFQSLSSAPAVEFLVHRRGETRTLRLIIDGAVSSPPLSSAVVSSSLHR